MRGSRLQYLIDTRRRSQHFRNFRYKEGDRHKAIIAELWEYTTRWLKPISPREHSIVDKVVLEQVFFTVLFEPSRCIPR